MLLPASLAKEAAAKEAAAAARRRNAGRPLVLIVEGAESVDPLSLQDLILVLAEVRQAGGGGCCCCCCLGLRA